MTNLETLSNKPLKSPSNWLVIVFAILSFFGFLDASLLTVKHYFGTQIGCPLFGNCEKVLNSPYASISGIPVALGGAFYYLIIFMLTVAYFDAKRAGIFYFAARLTLLGFLASFGFVYIQLFIIKAVCFYCLLSAAASTLLFIFGLYFLKSRKKPELLTK